MQKLKVRTFHPTARNALAFVLLSAIFIVLQNSLQSGLPFLNATFLTKMLRDEWLLWLLALPVGFATFRHVPSSAHFFALFCGYVAFRSMEGLFLSFDKLVLMVLFFHVVFSYGFYQLLVWTFQRAYFSPNYRSDIQATPLGITLTCTLQADGRVHSARLTNWDDEGAFLFLDEPLSHSCQECSVDVLWEGHTFQAKGSVVSWTLDARGIGVEWMKNSELSQGTWTEFITLMGDYGLDPRLLR
jgi:hypothetical protein